MKNDLMQYLPPVAQPQGHSGGAGKYHGEVASGYDAKRENSPKWLCEQRIIEGMLSDLAPGTTVLDCPVGTGRFLACYQSLGFRAIGMDISPDMLTESIGKICPDELQAWVDACNQTQRILPVTVDNWAHFRHGDVRDTKLTAKSVDVAVNCRITRWLSPDDCQKMIREMQRVCRQRIIWTARVANHPHARTIDLFEAALDGWEITHNEVGSDLDYRILQARPI